MNIIQELENMAKSYGLEFANKGNGHIQLSNHGFLVNYWPLSKNRTVHTSDGITHKHCSNYDAVKICMKNAKVGAKPIKKKIKENVADHDFKPHQSKKPKPRNLYSGEKPPWEYQSMIQCWSDIWRNEAYELQQRAANLECKTAYEDCI